MAITFTTLTTDKLQLRHFREGDIHKVHEGLSHPEVIRYYGVHYNTLSETVAQMRWFTQLEETDQGIWLAMTSPNGAVFYGALGLNNLSQINRKAEIGFWLLPDFWGKGYMTEAVQLLCRYGFEQLKLHRIEAFVETPNQGSKSLLAKLNFEHEGTMKNCEIKNGCLISLDIYAKLASADLSDLAPQQHG